jgi:hypothetical protein
VRTAKNISTPKYRYASAAAIAQIAGGNTQPASASGRFAAVHAIDAQVSSGE